MIVGKGKSRGNGRQLGAYLLRDPKNAEAELVGTRGFGDGDLAAVLAAAEIDARENTRGEKPFYFTALALEDGESLTPEQWREAVEIAERHLGYEGLDRAVVRHRKEDRRPDEPDHYHVAWNRHDKETGRLRSDSFNGQKLRDAMDEIEERFNLRLRADHPRHDQARTSDAEARQDERSTKPKRERAEEITGLWNTTDSGKAFRAGLEEAGYTLAHGKSRAYCVVDENGEVHSLARQIKGARAADIKARLADLDPTSIPDADAIRAAILQARQERGAETGTTPQQPPQSRAERQAEREADAAAIRAAEAAPAGPEPHIQTPRERTEAERQASAGMAAAILERVTWGRSTFTRTDLEREAAKMTGHNGRESWMAQTGGLDALDDRHRASAERSYEKWAEENPRPAAKYGLADYVAYAQEREAERQAETDPDALRQQADRREAFRHVMAAIDQSGEVVSVAKDEPEQKKAERFTTRTMLRAELEMEAAAAILAERGGHTVRAKTRDTVRKQTEKVQGFDLSGEQRDALRHVTGPDDLALVVGYAGAGKSTMLAAARGAWEAQGFRVRGTALSGIAARGLEDSAGIESVNLHRLLHRLDGQAEREAKVEVKADQLTAKIGSIRGKSEKAQKYRADLTRQITDMREDVEKGRLSARDVLVVDEAAMIGSKQMGRLLSHAMEAGAKVVLVGDHEQVQAIEAGAAFPALMERHGAAVMQDVRRQSEEWQREATKAFPQGRPADALNAYRDHGMTHQSATRDDAKAELVTAWSKARQKHPDASSVILTHLNADVHDLNQLGRAAYRAEGRLGEDREITLKDGAITLAEGDRLLFRKNDGHLDVRNGSLGTVRKIEGEAITVALDTAKGNAGQGREVTFNLSDYQEFSHGYAATVHKTQGATVDRAFVLATPGMDRNTAYVAMSRHRDRADLFHAREDFKDHDAMTRRLSRNGAKDSVLDYLRKAEQGHGFATSFRAAVSGLWDKISGVFRRGEHHPAEAAEQAREQAARAAMRPGVSFIEAVRHLAEKDRQEEAKAKAREERSAAPPKVDPAHAKERVRDTTERPPERRRMPEAKRPEEQRPADAEAQRLADRAAQVARLREEERKRRQNELDGPGGRGG